MCHISDAPRNHPHIGRIQVVTMSAPTPPANSREPPGVANAYDGRADGVSSAVKDAKP
jgi:hypothetical protein